MFSSSCASSSGSNSPTTLAASSGFRWSVPTYGAVEQKVRRLIAANPKARRWYKITPQYVFGEGLLSAAKNIFQE